MNADLFYFIKGCLKEKELVYKKKNKDELWIVPPVSSHHMNIIQLLKFVVLHNIL
jgi:hypothetical protein